MDRRDLFPPNDAAGSRPSTARVGFPAELRALPNENDFRMEENKIHRAAGNRRIRHSSTSAPRRRSVRSRPRLAVRPAGRTSLRLSIPDAACRRHAAAALNRGLFRAAGNRTRSTSTPWTRTTGILRPASGVVLCRAAGNRTRSTRTRSVRTTGILRPDTKHLPCALCRIRTCDLSRVKRTL